MNAQAYPMFESFQMKPRMISGVCGWIATQAGLPVWIVRVVALIMFCSHPPLMLLLYFGMAIWLYGRNRGTWRSMRTRYSETTTSYNYAGSGTASSTATWQASSSKPGSAAPDVNGGLGDRFGRLDRRLAELEAVVVDREANLRRAFRELDR
jgi:phage shock protein PspC (stress-responsive transcriptional regulator)